MCALWKHNILQQNLFDRDSNKEEFGKIFSRVQANKFQPISICMLVDLNTLLRSEIIIDINRAMEKKNLFLSKA